MRSVMKKINYIGLFLAALVMLSSCKRALDAPLKSSIEDKELYSTVRLAEGVITGILQTFAETNSYRGRYCTLWFQYRYGNFIGDYFFHY